MKKNSFVEGTVVASISLIIIKILGALYVIPFYSIVGQLGGALYSYAYNVYSLVLNICIVGIPPAISKIVSEYNTLEMYEAKERTLKIGSRLVTIISSLLFAFTFIFARELSYIFIGDSTGGNSIESISLVIRSISFCLLIVPLLAVKKGYLQGQKFISASTNSQLIEQIVRILFILVGSYLAINMFHLNYSIAVAVAVFGSYVGGLSAYLYIEYKIRKNKELFNLPSKNQVDSVSNKTIVNKIFKFSIPLIVVAMATDIYNITDISLINRGLTMLNYDGKTAETIASIIATWASKICLIVNAIASGLSISMIPNMVSSAIKKDSKAVNDYFIKSLGIVILVALPMAIGISILSNELYYIFYGESEFGSIVLRLLPFSVFLSNINLVINSALQSLNKFKIMYFSTFIGLITNAFLDIPLMFLCDKVGIYPYYGAIFATICGVVISLLLSLSKLKKEMQFRYKSLFNIIIKIVYPALIMGVIVYVTHYFVGGYFNTRLLSFIPCLICALIGALVYFVLVYKNGVLEFVFGNEYISNILKKLRLKK